VVKLGLGIANVNVSLAVSKVNISEGKRVYVPSWAENTQCFVLIIVFERQICNSVVFLSSKACEISVM